MKKLLYKLRVLMGGRPMVLVHENYFTDQVSGKQIHVYRDFFGRHWLAENRWGSFRVQAKFDQRSFGNR